MKELDAVNMLLRLTGSSPVNSLESNHPDVANARVTLKRVRKQLQQAGWWFNIDYNIVLTPNNSNEIVFGSTISSVKTHDTSLIKRGNKLYNRSLQTYKFYQPITVQRITYILDWDDMPDTMQSYCAYYAASQFVRDELEDANKQADLDKSAAMALIDLRAQDLDEGQYNIFDKSRVRKARYGTQPYLEGNWRYKL